jgi:hypothetical protein
MGVHELKRVAGLSNLGQPHPYKQACNPIDERVIVHLRSACS